MISLIIPWLYACFEMQCFTAIFHKIFICLCNCSGRAAFHWYSWTEWLTQIALFCCALTLKLQMNSSAGEGELDLLVISDLFMIGNCLEGYVYMVASHATWQDDGKITLGVETFHNSKCWFFTIVTNINDGNYILVETLVAMITM